MLSRFFSRICFNSNIGFIAVFLSAFFLVYFISVPDFELNHVSRLYFSQATLDGVDVNARIQFFYKMILELILMIPIVYSLLFLGYERCQSNLKWFKLPALVSLFGLAFLIVGLFDNSLRVPVFILILIVLLLYVFFVVINVDPFFKGFSLNRNSNFSFIHQLKRGYERTIIRLNLKKQELNQFVVIFVTIVSLVICSWVGVQCKDVIIFCVCFLLYLILYVWISKRYLERRVLTNSIYLSYVFAISFLLTHAIVFVFELVKISLSSKCLLFYIIATLLLFLFNFIIRKKRKLISGIIKYSSLFILLPIMIFACSELIVIQSSVSRVFVALIIFFFICLIFLLLIRRSKHRFNATKVMGYFVLPSVLISFVLQTCYHPYVSLPGDFYEVANIANAQMRVWEFHEIPCLNFMSSHMLSEQYFGFIYHSIFGYDGSLNFLSYSFLDYILLFFIIYVFCNKLFGSPILSILFVLLFPYYLTFFNESMIFLSIILYSIYKIIENPSIKSVFIFLLLLLLSVLWKLDIGSTAILAGLVFTFLIYFTERIKFPFLIWSKSIAMFLALISIILVAILPFYSWEYLFTQCQNALHYISANQAHAYSKLWEAVDKWTLFFYFVLPFIATVSCIGIVGYKRMNNSITSRGNFILNSSLFFFIVVLVNFQRGLVRHNLLEYNESFIASTFYLALSLLLLFIFNKKSPIVKYSFIILSATLLITVLSRYGIPQEPSFFQRLLSSNLSVEEGIARPTDAIQRVRFPSDTEPISFTQLNHFLESNLTPTQTFLDFSNSPMLYYFTQRKVPSYFCQSLQNTIDDFTQLQQIRSINPNDVPIVIYSNYPTNWYDATDGVPNAMRYHVLAEYIYLNYKPFGIIDHKHIWVAKNSMFVNSGFEQDITLNDVQELDYKNAAISVNEFYTNKAKNQIITIKNLVIDTNNSNAILTWVNSGIQHKQAIYLKLKFQNSQKDTVKLLFYEGDKAEAKILFATNEKNNSYMIPISNLYSWYQSDSLHLKLESTTNMKLISAEFLQDTTADFTRFK